MIEDYFGSVIQDLTVSRLISSFTILRIEIGEEDGYIRAKCELSNGDIFEFAEYVTVCSGKIEIGTYSFHWQTEGGQLRRRWDNIPHHRNLDTFPDHMHLSNKVVASFPMTLKEVLATIEEVVLPAQ